MLEELIIKSKINYDVYHELVNKPLHYDMFFEICIAVAKYGTELDYHELFPINNNYFNSKICSIILSTALLHNNSLIIDCILNNLKYDIEHHKKSYEDIFEYKVDIDTNFSLLCCEKNIPEHLDYLKKLYSMCYEEDVFMCHIFEQLFAPNIIEHCCNFGNIIALKWLVENIYNHNHIIKIEKSKMLELIRTNYRRLPRTIDESVINWLLEYFSDDENMKSTTRIMLRNNYNIQNI